MSTITISVKSEVEKMFRKVAGSKYGKRKGYLGKAITEAMLDWSMKERRNLEIQSMEILEEGLEMGKIKFTDRDELHERR